MKHAIISADGDSKVYLVPDVVADNLEEYCMEFCTQWIKNSPHAKKYRTGRGLCYNEDDFIEYLNTWMFPDEKSILVENLGWSGCNAPLPEPYRDCPEFNF